MQIPNPPLPPERMAEFRAAGHWPDWTSNDKLEYWGTTHPEKTALIDRRVRLTFGDYWQRVNRLAAHFVELGLTSDDVIAVQLPNWSEFAIVTNAAMLTGIPFCQFHSDFRSREVGFILDFTKATTIVIPRVFRNFDHVAMLEDLRKHTPHLKHVLVVGDDVPGEYFDLGKFLDTNEPPSVPDVVLRERRPKGTDLQRTAFTSGTTGNPKAVLHIHSADDAGVLPSMEAQRMGSESVLLVFMPVGLNWGFHNTLMGAIGGCTIVFLDTFRAEDALTLIEREKVTHFGCAPAHLVSMLGVPNLESYDLSSLQVFLTGGASCPLEIIREVRAKLPGHLLELYGMLEAGTLALTSLDDDPEAVGGLVGKPWWQIDLRIVDDENRELPADEVGEILVRGPSLTIGYHNNTAANAEAFTPDGWFHTGDLGVLDPNGYLKIVGRKKEMIIRGGANIYPREIEEVLFEHPAIRDVAIIGVPDPRLGERVCACIVPQPGSQFDFDEMSGFLRGRIAIYKLPELLCMLSDLPRTPTGKVQKVPLHDVVDEEKRAGRLTGRVHIAG